MRAIGIDVHRDFCELAISENGRLRSAGRVPSTPEQLELLAQSLGPDDEVALETTGNALAIARIIEPHVARVVVASAKELHAITGAKAKTDRRDARTLARLLAAGLLEGTWLPDEATRALRRRLQRREQLVRQRSRLKNEIHATLYRNLAGVGPASDLFGAAGRRWLAGLALPADERETIDGCLRVLDFLGEEVDRLEQAVAGQALVSPEIRRLVTIPGVNLITAATLMAVIGDVGRFASARKLVGYLGLDPRVRQSGSSPARTGRISKEGAASARRVLCEAAQAAMRTPGPLRAFGQRVRARRGHQVAVVAVARKLASLAWRLLSSGQDYAYASPSRVALKLRRIELRAGAPRQRGRRSNATLNTRRERERELALAAERAYQRLVSDWQASAKKDKGAGAATGRASEGVPEGPSSAADPQAPASAL
jgi:transposase